MSFIDEFNKMIQREFQALLNMLQSNQLDQVRQIQPQIEEDQHGKRITWGPIIYGRTTIVTPDGKVTTKDFSNIPTNTQRNISGSPTEQMFPPGIQAPPQPPRPRPAEPYPKPLEPTPNPLPHPQLKEADNYLIDVIDKENGFIVIFELPATSAEEVQTSVEGRRIRVKVNGTPFRELELPVEVELEEQCFKNGVIEIKLRHLLIPNQQR